ncbi:MAG: ImmA/IrrE family metallo-endopeptidase [Candidatus Thiodiazotropha sp. (ex Troendleina suluensis)]|nr:ImmA/IrrE family metallo-endopeptidase [Candidatus Thiodiazotropha sp. (ex Troendleina suluensis)]
MALNLTLVGSKIRRYREQLELSVQELSVATGIISERLELYEAGKREPTGDEILILADFFRCDYNFFISNEKLAPFEETEQLYRRYGNDFSKADRRSIQDFLFLCENEECLTRQLGLVKSRQQFEFRKIGDYYKGHGEQAALALRQHLDYGPNEVGMNIYEDIRRIGVHIFRRKLGNSNISGLYIRHPTAGKCVLVNYSEDVYRQRFTAGHEVAHTILDDEEDFVVSFVKWDRQDLVETRANTFSSRYLMPPEFLQSIPKAMEWTVEKGVEWAKQLRVSTEALAYALRDANLIGGEFVSQLKAARVPLDQKIDPELPLDLTARSRERKQQLLEKGLSGHYVELCFEAYNKGVISRGKLAECLILDDTELQEVAELYGRSLAYGD